MSLPTALPGPTSTHDLPLIVCATEAEAANVAGQFGVVITGLGKVAAAVATTRALAARDRAGLLSRTLVLNLGTAGALVAGIEGIHLPSRVLNHDLSAELVRTLGYEPMEWLEIPGGDGSILATGDTFVTDPAVRDRLAAVAGLVDMEGYAVAFAAHSLGVPARLVKHISDNADEQAMEWADLVADSARALGEWLNENYA